MIEISKAKIDRAGRSLSHNIDRDEYTQLESELLLDDYRRRHLQPLSETTIEIQKLLTNFGTSYYIAQRLKRKPQIMRKLKRLSVRLTQLQDIAGCRIIVHKNSDVNNLQDYIVKSIEKQSVFSIERMTDYRERGRDDTGYRALHIILKRNKLHIELQIRSRIQHYWSESIERTSVIYGHHLKEGEGDKTIIRYFKVLSDAFFDIEGGHEPNIDTRLSIDNLRERCEFLIKASQNGKNFDSYVNEDIIKTLVQKESSNKGTLNNWILVFDWNQGNFVSWDIVSRIPDEAVASYIEYERQFPVDEGYEVVLVGSSDVATVRQTHSHYFGIETYGNTLENIDSSIIGFSRKIDIDVGARQILSTLHRRHFWGKKTASIDTLKNHFCKGVLTFDSSMQTLLDRKLIHLNNGISLNISKKSDIEQYL